jgi:hypothetical protein
LLEKKNCGGKAEKLVWQGMTYVQHTEWSCSSQQNTVVQNGPCPKDCDGCEVKTWEWNPDGTKLGEASATIGKGNSYEVTWVTAANGESARLVPNEVENP